MRSRRKARARALQALYSGLGAERLGLLDEERDVEEGPGARLDRLRLHFPWPPTSEEPDEGGGAERPSGRDGEGESSGRDGEGERMGEEVEEREEEDAHLSLEIVEGVETHGDEIDSLITRAAENWRPERMDPVDRCIIRMGTFELAFMPEIPPAATINEAVELARSFGSSRSPAFVNGVLDRVRRILQK
jgi:N utilization substance protein B